MAEFLHPSFSSKIIDNSTVFVSAQGLTTLYAAFPAEQGPDNRPFLVTSDSEFLFYYGAPNMRKYGQTAYNVVRWLRAGGQAFCNRVLPYMEKDADDNALQQSTYAAYILEIGTKSAVEPELWVADTDVNIDEVFRVVDGLDTFYFRVTSAGRTGVAAPNHTAGEEVNGTATFLSLATPPGKFIKVRVRTLGDGLKGTLATRAAIQAIEKNVRDDKSIEDIVLASPDSPESDGFRYIPLLALRGRDRGSKFNSFGFRFELTDGMDETYAHRLYELGVFSSASKSEETFTVSFYPEAADVSGMSQFITSVLAKYSNLARCIFNEDNYDEICEYINEDATVARKLDIIRLQERNVTVAEALHTDVGIFAGSADLSPTPEVFLPMGGGTDGDWVGPNSLESLLYKAYSGSGDFIIESTGENRYDTYFADLWDTKAYPIDMILDANYPTSVKVAISNFAKARGDFFSILDVGFTGSPGQALKYRQDQLSLNTFFSAIFVQDMMVFDEFTGRDIRVTPTFYLAAKIPLNDRDYGIHWTFTGPRRGTIEGYEELSWIPNASYREMLYRARLNYIEVDTRSARFMPQSTTQLQNSALSDISHVRTLLRIRREVQELAEDYYMEFNSQQTWAQMEFSLNNTLKKYESNGACTSIKATVYASEYDKLQRIVRIKLEMSFTGLIERIFADLVVNR